MEETIRIYGGRDIVVDNVTIVNGGIDPWYVLGLTDTSRTTDKMDVLFIKDGSHCADMRVVPKYDTPALKAVRYVCFVGVVVDVYTHAHGLPGGFS